MVKFFYFTCVLAAICLFMPGSSSLADDSGSAETHDRKMTKRSAAFLKNYDYAEAATECIGSKESDNDVEDYRGLDRFRMIFEMEDGTIFLNEMPGRRGCRDLGKNPDIRFQRTEDRGRCVGDTIYLTTAGGDDIMRSSGAAVPKRCKLGMFYELTRKPAAETAQ